MNGTKLVGVLLIVAGAVALIYGGFSYPKSHEAKVGPVAFDVTYDLRPGSGVTEVLASVAVSGRGLTGRLLAQATDALFAGGALQHAVSRIAREVETALA